MRFLSQEKGAKVIQATPHVTSSDERSIWGLWESFFQRINLSFGVCAKTTQVVIQLSGFLFVEFPVMMGTGWQSTFIFQCWCMFTKALSLNKQAQAWLKFWWHYPISRDFNICSPGYLRIVHPTGPFSKYLRSYFTLTHWGFLFF